MYSSPYQPVFIQQEPAIRKTRQKQLSLHSVAVTHWIPVSPMAHSTLPIFHILSQSRVKKHAPNHGKNSCWSFSRVVKGIFPFQTCFKFQLYGFKNYLTQHTLPHAIPFPHFFSPTHLSPRFWESPETCNQESSG